MTTSSRFRTTSRLGRWSGLLLVTAMLPLLGPAAPAHAAECTSEETPTPTFPPTLPPDYGCDDVAPPDTTITSMSPTPNASGWTKANDVSFEFEEIVNDADAGPWTFMCKLEGPSAQGHDWQECHSPTIYTDLEDTNLEDNVLTDYTFSVFAVDEGDSSIAFLGNPSILVPEDDEDQAAQPDDDSASPATRTWKQDAVDPVALISGGPTDSEGTGWPIARRPQVTFLLDAFYNENVTYRCLLDGQQVACDEGRLTLKNLSGGNHVLSARVTDAAGNTDASPAIAQFVVPHNLTESKNWTRKNGKGYFAGDVLQTKRYGATIKFRAQNIQGFRLIAPAGPTLGKIQVRTGNFRWQTYNLGRKKATRSRVYVIRDAQSSLFSGRILIRSISRDKPVRVDALVFPPS